MKLSILLLSLRNEVFSVELQRLVSGEKKIENFILFKIPENFLRNSA